MNKINICEAEQISDEDLHQLSLLLVNVVNNGASIGFLPPLPMEVAEEYWRGVIHPDTILWVARMNGIIIGSVQLILCRKQNGSHRAEIAKLMVHTETRRNGIGRNLMEAAEGRAKNEGRSLLVLDTRAGDPSNLLYKSLGYIEAGRVPLYAKSADGRLHETVFYYKQI
ncbi:MAG: GNAT family N-acetyltransferase [Clostridia bacterium]|nr:GNAT family N-acetyltransferase [Clostridia bacterium]